MGCLLDRKEQSRQYYLRNRETIIAKNAEYQKLHREERTIKQRRWKEEHPEQVLIHRETEYLTFKSDETKLAKHNECGKTNYRILRDSIFDIIGNQCAKCGFSDIRVLQVDHIHGNGNQHRKTSANHYQNMKSILNDPGILQKFQCLCANCNMIKRAENNENARRRIH